MRPDRRAPGAILACCLLATALTGCGTGTPTMSKQEETNFKGGPMPENARKIMQQKLEEARNKRPGAAAPGAPR